MSISDLQLKLHQKIDSITDSKKLEELYSLLNAEEQTFKAKSLKEYISNIDEARRQIKNGKSSTLYELLRDSENW
jgi:DNA-binding MurR/RpiR family transcriptional regulator